MKAIIPFLVLVILFGACSKDDEEVQKPVPKNPDTAPYVSVDRFSAEAGTLMVRSAENGLPQANQAIAFDVAPFITQCFGPDGRVVRYYNFDVQALAPVPVYVFSRASTGNAVDGQLNVIDVIPGEQTYSDFWQVYKVKVPDDYVANTAASYANIVEQKLSVEKTNIIVNCPVVPDGSTANEGIDGNANELHCGWYKEKIVCYFHFGEKELQTAEFGLVPVSPIYVCFLLNPDSENPASGPASGFITEPGTVQTHNVIATIPSDADYSPMWAVNIYNNQYFDQVKDLTSVLKAEILVEKAAYVNCPVVYVAENK